MFLGDTTLEKKRVNLVASGKQANINDLRDQSKQVKTIHKLQNYQFFTEKKCGFNFVLYIYLHKSQDVTKMDLD